MKNELFETIGSLNPTRFIQIARFFFPYLRHYRWKMAGILLLTFVVVIFNVAQPWPFKFLFDYLLVDKSSAVQSLGLLKVLENNRYAVTIICGVVFIIALGRGLSEYFQIIATRHIGQKVMVTLRRNLFERIQALSLNFHKKARSGDLLMRLTGDVNLLRDLFVDLLIQTISSSATIAFIGIVMFVLNWKLSLLVLSVLPFMLLVNFASSIGVRKAASKQRKRESEISVTAHEALLGIQTIQAYGREKTSQSVFDKFTKRSFKEGMRIARIEARTSQLTEIFLALSVVLAIWYGSHQVMAVPPLQTPGDLLLYYFYLRTLQKPIRGAAKLMVRAGKAAASAERVMEIFMQQPEIKDLPDAVDAPEVKGEITLNNLTFCYSDEEKALNNINLHIRPGEKIGLVGPSGAGKSTLCSLVCRFYDPESGMIRVDGEDIRKYRVKSLRKQIGYMSQEPMLFASTIYENLSFAREDASYEHIIQAARQARADEFIKRLPESYNTLVTERGLTLSHGQKQRIALARSFLRRAPILILDEPTSNVDAKSERIIIKAVRDMMRNSTCIIISHNIRMIRSMDRIIVMNKGEIVEEGTHQELLKKGGLYIELLDDVQIDQPVIKSGKQ